MDKVLKIDLTSKSGIKKLFDNIDKDIMLSGVNENGEDCILSLNEDRNLEVRVFQKNGWLRIDEYDRNKLTKICELFDERWK